MALGWALAEAPWADLCPGKLLLFCGPCPRPPRPSSAGWSPGRVSFPLAASLLPVFEGLCVAAIAPRVQKEVGGWSPDRGRHTSR